MVRDMLALRQVDAKYIISMSESRYLVALDQHAVDERIKLESLQRDVSPASHELTSPFLVSLSFTQLSDLTVYADQIGAWGWQWSTDRDGATVHAVPLLFGHVLGEPDHFLDFLTCLHTNQGSSVIKPPCITRLLQSRACRSAVMFGDVLSLSKCRSLLTQLKDCNLPFQCAHGRPSIHPLIDLDSLPEDPFAQAATTTTTRSMNLSKVRNLCQNDVSLIKLHRRRLS